MEKIASVFAVNEWTAFEPRYNIAPSQLAPVIINVNGTRVLDLYRWGLIPPWAREMKMSYKMINARCETVGEKPSYRRLVNKRRCLILTDGFFEWQKSEDGKSKTPMRIIMQPEAPFAFAGLWDEWRVAEGQPLRSYTILTTEANPLLKVVHNRMPVILRPECIASWFDPGMSLNELVEMFEPYPENEMTYYPVSKAVNNPRNDGPTCWERAGGRSEGDSIAEERQIRQVGCWRSGVSSAGLLTAKPGLFNTWV